MIRRVSSATGVRCRAAVLLGGSLVALVGSAPDWSAIGAVIRHPNAAATRDGADATIGTLASGLVFVLAAWLTLGVVSSALALLPGALGEAMTFVAGAVTPHAVRVAVAGAFGASLALVPLAASANTATDPAAPISQLAIGWPMDGHSTADLPPTPITWPTDDGSGPAPTPAPGPTGTTSTHVVVGGETLWSIAAGSLDADADDSSIATRAQDWYAANTIVIGADPNLILPGQVLHTPSA